jgi:hypothetical protein
MLLISTASYASHNPMPPPEHNQSTPLEVHQARVESCIRNIRKSQPKSDKRAMIHPPTLTINAWNDATATP